MNKEERISDLEHSLSERTFNLQESIKERDFYKKRYDEIILSKDNLVRELNGTRTKYEEISKENKVRKDVIELYRKGLVKLQVSYQYKDDTFFIMDLP